MSYAVNSDIETRVGSSKYVQLTDDDGLGSADESKVTQARTFAESEMDSYLARRYAVPVDTAGNADLAVALRAVAVDLAVHRLYERKPPVPADIKQRHDWAIAWLEAVANGSVTLPAGSELPPNTSQGLVAEIAGKPRVLTQKELMNL